MLYCSVSHGFNTYIIYYFVLFNIIETSVVCDIAYSQCIILDVFTGISINANMMLL